MNRRTFPTTAQQHLLKTVRLDLAGPDEIGRWNELIERHHYLHNATALSRKCHRLAEPEKNS